MLYIYIMRSLLLTCALLGIFACNQTAEMPASDTASDASMPNNSVPDNSSPTAALTSPIKGCAPAPLPSTGDPHEDCVARINQLRMECQKLPPLSRWENGERCADDQARYDSTRGPHAGFADGICETQARGQNECPGWRSHSEVLAGCLQQMWDEGPGEDFAAHGHYLNMTNDAFNQVACGFYTTPGGEVWSVQNFR